MGIDEADHLRVVLPFMDRAGSSKALRTPRSASGFSLLEMIVVLVIIGMAAALLAPAVGNSIDNIRFRSIVRQVSASLRNARSQAVAHKVNFEVIFDPEHNRYTIAPQQLEKADASGRPDGLGEGSDAGEARLWPPKHKSLPKGIMLRTEGGQPKKIVFYPRGNSSGGTIEIERSRGNKLLIVVDRITGRVKVTAPESS